VKDRLENGELLDINILQDTNHEALEYYQQMSQMNLGTIGLV
jgi:hypothetical protein